VEAAGASVAVEQAWKAALGTAGRGPVTRRTETDEVPWFEMTYAREIPGLRVFLMEYHRDFLARWYGPLTPVRSITRADVLDRYVAKIDRRREGTLLEPAGGPPGITEVAFSLRHAVDATHLLGTAELRLEGRSARLRFRPAR